ncbi:MAG: hypothetical protein IRZ16_21145 [Myxococcaceae bacterium]|nr:hypothetical protein [Myxococcaceae bacterium]
MIRILVSSALVALCACATTSKAEEAQLARLRDDNQSLRAQLSEASKAASAGFQQAGSAETAAGVANASCSVIAPASGNPAPRSGAVHAKLRLGTTTFLLQPQLGGTRRAGAAMVAGGTCAVGRR